LQLIGRVGVNPLDLKKEAFEDGNAFADLIECQQVGFVAVVEIGSVIADLIGQVDELGFERRALVEQIFGQVRMLCWIIIARVLDDASRTSKVRFRPRNAA